MKIVIVALIAFMLGFGAYWGYNQYQTVLKENQELKKLEKSIPSSTDEEAIPTATVTPTKAIETKGTIEGELGYPSEGIPALEVYAFNSIDQSKYFLIKTGQNQGTFTIKDVDPGTYYVVAYPVGSNSSLAGGYSKMVPCGLTHRRGLSRKSHKKFIEGTFVYSHCVLRQSGHNACCLVCQRYNTRTVLKHQHQ